jgi:hypothetical protein
MIRHHIRTQKGHGHELRIKNETEKPAKHHEAAGRQSSECLEAEDEMNANAQRDNCNPESTTIFQGSVHINDSAEPIYSIKTTDEHRWTQIRQRELTRVDEHRECHYLVTRSRSGRCSFGSASVLICVHLWFLY